MRVKKDSIRVDFLCSLMALTRLVCDEALFKCPNLDQSLPAMRELCLSQTSFFYEWLSDVASFLPNLTRLDFEFCELEEDAAQDEEEVRQISTLR